VETKYFPRSSDVGLIDARPGQASTKPPGLFTMASRGGGVPALTQSMPTSRVTV